MNELLNRGHNVIGLDDNSKYGAAATPISNDQYELVIGDAGDPDTVNELASSCDYFVANAAMVGGVSYIHSLPYDILATNERITAVACDAAIAAHSNSSLRKLVVVSSSMVFDSSSSWPTAEGTQLQIPPPRLAYGFQKLSVEYFVRAAHEQYGLPYTIVRPFNAVGVGEFRASRSSTVGSGDVQFVMSHVVPDIIHKLLLGQDPVHLLGSGNQRRHFTAAADIAKGISDAIEKPSAINQDFNLSSPYSCSVRELAEMIHSRVRGAQADFHYVSDPPYPSDVQQRQPDVSKALALLGWEASTTIDEMLDEVVPWVTNAFHRGWL